MPNFDSPRIVLIGEPTPVHEMAGLREALGGGPRLLIKRDDAIPFGFGGNKVRKLEYVLAAAVDAGANTIVTVGGVQSNHARATAAAPRGNDTIRATVVPSVARDLLRSRVMTFFITIPFV